MKFDGVTGYNKTVSAISTPPGKGGVALIRTSGSEAVKIAARCFVPRSGRSLCDCPPRTAVYGDILLGGQKIDDGIAIIFRAPGSFTGEDVVEITCHGGITVTSATLRALFEAGSEPASAGEFTRRAFLAGKLTLTEAEAIGDLLEAGSIGQLALFSHDSRSRLSHEIGELHAMILSILSRLFAAIDFPDEDISAFDDNGLSSEISRAREAVSHLASTFDTGRAVALGVPTVICGSPNVGKSSLYNLLCRSEQAIVTDIAGTTRDLLRSRITLGRVTLELCDTAGIRGETSDRIEQIGIERSIEEMSRAELVIALFDASRPRSDDDTALLARLAELRARGAKVVVLNNKSDLGREYAVGADSGEFDYVFDFSTRTEFGLDELSNAIEQMFIDGSIALGQDAVVSTQRQYAALTRAIDFLDGALSALRYGGAPDAASSELELALGELAGLDGRDVSGEIVDEIFSKFCVGK